MKTDRQLREESFAKMTAKFPHRKVSSLIAVYKIPYSDFDRLKQAANLYMSRCLDMYEYTSGALLVQFTHRYKEIKNITPNGLIVPKNHTILEYNILNQAFYNIISKLGIEDFITSWHVPLNLRIKLGHALEENMARNHPTEYIHSDSWAGESANSVTTMIPIFGDIAKNHVKFYQPPMDFQEEWLGPRPSYKDGQEIAARYTPIDFVPEAGQLIISDFATTHASSRIDGAGSRVSIDTTFALKRHKEDEIIHPWREGERATSEVVNNLGTKYLFSFPDSVNEQVDSQGGFKHPTNLEIKKL
jgi:hypothetical protein